MHIVYIHLFLFFLFFVNNFVKTVRDVQTLELVLWAILSQNINSDITGSFSSPNSDTLNMRTNLFTQEYKKKSFLLLNIKEKETKG